MTNTTGFARRLTLFGTLALAAAAGGAWAQEEVPAPPPPGAANGMQGVEGVSPSYDLENLQPLEPQAQEFDGWDPMPVATESTSTWLRRGLWSAQVDAVVMVRQWDTAGTTLAIDASNAQSEPPPFRGLEISPRGSGAEGSARLNLGRFLFRDVCNRDHTTEFVVFGGGEFVQECKLVPIADNSIFIPSALDKGADASFDNSTDNFVQYASRFNSFEWNYKVHGRMGHDQMVMLPDGQWIRRASSGLTWHGLAGMRYFDLTENLHWTAENIITSTNTVTFTGETGQYDIRTSNDMFGFQAGGGVSYESDRWSITASTKGGVLMNDAKTHNVLSFLDPATGEARDDVGFDNRAREGTLPFLVQFSTIGRYHLRPNVSMRFGYELLFVTATAMAPHQINFRPDPEKVTTSGDSFYHGITMGMEVYW